MCSASTLGTLVLYATLTTLAPAARHNKNDATTLYLAARDLAAAKVNKADQQRAEVSDALGTATRGAEEASKDPMGRVSFSMKLPGFPPKPQRPPANPGVSIPAPSPMPRPSPLHKLPIPWPLRWPFVQHNGAHDVATHGVAGSAETSEATGPVSPRLSPANKLSIQWSPPWRVLLPPWKKGSHAAADDEGSLKATLFSLNLEFLEFVATLPPDVANAPAAEVPVGVDTKAQMPIVVIVDALRHFLVVADEVANAKAALNLASMELQNANVRAGMALEDLNGLHTLQFDGSSPDGLTMLEDARAEVLMYDADVEKRSSVVFEAERVLKVAEEEAEARFAESTIWLRAISELSLVSGKAEHFPEYFEDGLKAQVAFAEIAVKLMEEAKDMVSTAKVAFLDKSETLAALEALYDEKLIRDSSQTDMVKARWRASGRSRVLEAKEDVAKSASRVQEATVELREGMDKAELALARANLLVSSF